MTLARCGLSVGLFPMDQAAMAGVGNIYRAEILFKVCTLGEACGFLLVLFLKTL